MCIVSACINDLCLCACAYSVYVHTVVCAVFLWYVPILMCVLYMYCVYAFMCAYVSVLCELCVLYICVSSVDLCSW